jgi:D-glycero-beta-D-manno-heptose 1-phosphate adenylyltransferase
MSQLSQIHNKIKDAIDIAPLTAQWKTDGKSIVFTNGCFDLLHLGHIEYLAQASEFGDKFIIGLNSDKSVRLLGKGSLRPIKDEKTRATMLAAFSFVDAVVIFNNDTPHELISTIIPDVLIKGGDWGLDAIVGSEVVKNNGGEVKTIPFVDGYSSTNYVEKIQNGKD